MYFSVHNNMRIKDIPSVKLKAVEQMLHSAPQWRGGWTSFAREIGNSEIHYCIHEIASGGYYGFRFVTPMLPLLLLQCVERFYHYHSNGKNILGSLLKFAGYIHYHKILPGNFFGLILKNKMAATGVFSTFSKDFCWPSRAKGIIGRDLKLAGYVHHYKILSGNIFGLIWKNKITTTGISFQS